MSDKRRDNKDRKFSDSERKSKRSKFYSQSDSDSDSETYKYAGDKRSFRGKDRKSKRTKIHSHNDNENESVQSLPDDVIYQFANMGLTVPFDRYSSTLKYRARTDIIASAIVSNDDPILDNEFIIFTYLDDGKAEIFLNKNHLFDQLKENSFRDSGYSEIFEIFDKFPDKKISVLMFLLEAAKYMTDEMIDEMSNDFYYIIRSPQSIDTHESVIMKGILRRLESNKDKSIESTFLNMVSADTKLRKIVMFSLPDEDYFDFHMKMLQNDKNFIWETKSNDIMYKNMILACRVDTCFLQVGDRKYSLPNFKSLAVFGHYLGQLQQNDTIENIKQIFALHENDVIQSDCLPHASYEFDIKHMKRYVKDPLFALEYFLIQDFSNMDDTNHCYVVDDSNVLERWDGKINKRFFNMLTKTISSDDYYVKDFTDILVMFTIRNWQNMKLAFIKTVFGQLQKLLPIQNLKILYNLLATGFTIQFNSQFNTNAKEKLFAITKFLHE